MFQELQGRAHGQAADQALVEEQLVERRDAARRHNTAHPYLLRALVSCGGCRLASSARAVNGRHFYDLCNGKRHGVDSRRATRSWS